MEDVEIVELYFKRSEKAISQTSKKYGRLLFTISNNILNSNEDSEECVNDTYEKVWYSIPPQRPTYLSAYLGRIVRNISINKWYKNRSQRRGGGMVVLLSELAECLPSQKSVEEETDRRVVVRLIEHWLLTLEKEQRVLFLRRYWYGFSLETLARENGVTVSKISGQLYRLRQKLKAELNKEGVVI